MIKRIIKLEYRHKQWCERIKLNPNMIDKESAKFLLYVDGMMGCHLSDGARKLCRDTIKQKRKIK